MSLSEIHLEWQEPIVFIKRSSKKNTKGLLSVQRRIIGSKDIVSCLDRRPMDLGAVVYDSYPGGVFFSLHRMCS